MRESARVLAPSSMRERKKERKRERQKEGQREGEREEKREREREREREGQRGRKKETERERERERKRGAARGGSQTRALEASTVLKQGCRGTSLIRNGSERMKRGGRIFSIFLRCKNARATVFGGFSQV